MERLAGKDYCIFRCHYSSPLTPFDFPDINVNIDYNLCCAHGPSVPLSFSQTNGMTGSTTRCHELTVKRDQGYDLGHSSSFLRQATLSFVPIVLSPLAIALMHLVAILFSIFGLILAAMAAPIPTHTAASSVRREANIISLDTSGCELVTIIYQVSASSPANGISAKPAANTAALTAEVHSVHHIIRCTASFKIKAA